MFSLIKEFCDVETTSKLAILDAITLASKHYYRNNFVMCYTESIAEFAIKNVNHFMKEEMDPVTLKEDIIIHKHTGMFLFLSDILFYSEDVTNMDEIRFILSLDTVKENITKDFSNLGISLDKFVEKLQFLTDMQAKFDASFQDIRKAE